MKTLATIGLFSMMAVLGSSQSADDFQKTLKSNPNSSMAHYGIANIHFQERSYQAAANEFRSALRGDLKPKWTEVWSHINLGKIIDINGQRERAIAEYNAAIETKDDTKGALAEASKFLKSPYVP